eukprot:COSAG01_NODE_3090_length_6601_cov_5.372347_5_plen_159_part_00
MWRTKLERAELARAASTDPLVRDALRVIKQRRRRQQRSADEKQAGVLPTARRAQPQPRRRLTLEELAAQEGSKYVYRTSCYGAHPVQNHRHPKILPDGSKAPAPSARRSLAAVAVLSAASKGGAHTQVEPKIPLVAPNTSLGEIDQAVRSSSLVVLCR